MIESERIVRPHSTVKLLVEIVFLKQGICMVTSLFLFIAYLVPLKK